MRITIIAFIIIFLSSCKNELNVLAPGKESVAVYGMLNPNEPVQNIRINKVYLVEGDALEAAQDNKQINYNPGELTVTLQRFVNGGTAPQLTTVGNATKKEIVLTETVVTTKSGTFNQAQRIWQTTDKLYSNGDYKLTITNVNTGAVFTSQTTVLDSVKTFGSQQPMPFLYIPTNPGTYPMHGNYPIPYTAPDKPKYVNYDPTSTKYSVKFRPLVPDGKLYSTVIRFHYVDSILGGTAVHNYIDYLFNDLRYSNSNITTNTFVEDFSFTGQSFYNNLANELAKRNVSNLKNRKADYLEYIVTAGSGELYDFLQVSAPSNTIAQDKPFYTNITGGVGVFASRSVSIVTKDMLFEMLDNIACNSITKPYKFCQSSGVICP